MPITIPDPVRVPNDLSESLAANSKTITPPHENLERLMLSIAGAAFAVALLPVEVPVGAVATIIALSAMAGSAAGISFSVIYAITGVRELLTGDALKAADYRAIDLAKGVVSNPFSTFLAPIGSYVGRDLGLERATQIGEFINFSLDVGDVLKSGERAPLVLLGGGPGRRATAQVLQLTMEFADLPFTMQNGGLSLEGGPESSEQGALRDFEVPSGPPPPTPTPPASPVVDNTPPPTSWRALLPTPPTVLPTVVPKPPAVAPVVYSNYPVLSPAPLWPRAGNATTPVYTSPGPGLGLTDEMLQPPPGAERLQSQGPDPVTNAGPL